MGRFTIFNKRYCVYGKTYNDCLLKVKQKRKELNIFESQTKNDKLILNNYFTFWFETFKKQILKESTYIKTIELYNRYVQNTLGKKNVKNIKATDLQIFINNIKAKNPKEKLYRLLKEVFEILNKEQIIKTNPFNLVIIPKDNVSDSPVDYKKKKMIISYQDELKLLDYCKNNNHYHHIIKFILYTGLRRGEALGMIWKNVDFINNTIYIDRQFNNDTNKITTPKSKAAYRTIPMFPETKEILKELFHEELNLNDLIFGNIKRLTQNLNNFGKKLGFNLNPHILRHTFASRCYAAGLDPKIIQDLLGHRTMSTTLDTYTHTLYDEKEYIINYFKDFFKLINYIK